MSRRKYAPLRDRREALLPKVKQMRDAGCSIGKISREINVPFRTTSRWIRKFELEQAILKFPSTISTETEMKNKLNKQGYQ